jgi:hypothetical protein
MHEIGETLEEEQRKACAQYGAPWEPAPAHFKVGASPNVRTGIVPVNGLRHPPIADTTGWYLWAGEGDPSYDPDFFVPVHVWHLANWWPEVLRFLGLGPGWRFLMDVAYEDVWHDPKLLGA